METTPKIPLDKLDRRILRILQEEGRISHVHLAERVGLSPTAATERVKRLTREGLITGYAARLDPVLLGLELLVFVEVTLDRTTADVFEKFGEAARRAPEVLECHLVAGGFDYLVKARIADMSLFQDFLERVILPLPGVRETHTYASVGDVKP